MSDNKIDDIFKQALNDFEQAPPIEAWEYVQASISSKKKNRGLIWWSSGIAAAIALLITGYGLGYYNFKKSNEFIQAEVSSTHSHSTSVAQKSLTSKSKTSLNGTTSLATTQAPTTITELNITKKSASFHKKIPPVFSTTAKTIEPTPLTALLHANNPLNTLSPLESKPLQHLNKEYQETLALNPYAVLSSEELHSKQAPQASFDRKIQITGQVTPEAYQSNLLGYANAVGNFSDPVSSVQALNTGLGVGMQISDRFMVSAGMNYTQKQGRISDSYASLYTYASNEENKGWNAIDPSILMSADVSVESNQTYLTGVFVSEEEAIALGNNQPNNQPVSIAPSTNASNASVDLNTLSFESSYAIRYIELPLELKFIAYKTTKANYFISSGIGTTFFSSIKKENRAQNQIANSTSENQNFSQHNLIFSTGVDLALGEKFQLGFAPIFRYGIASGNHIFLKGNTYSLGFSSGIRYWF